MNTCPPNEPDREGNGRLTSGPARPGAEAAHTACGRTVLAVGAARAAEEPPPAVRSRALGAVDDAGGFAAELLPDGIDQENGAVIEAGARQPR